MAEVLLSSDELTVLGGPAQITLDVDFGPQGDRGSLILYGRGKPTSQTVPQTPQIYDTYINVLPSDDKYMFIYHYIAGDDGSPGWTEIFKLTSNMYNENSQKTFIDGSTQLNVPVAAIVPADLIGSYLSENFSVQVSILNDNPIAHSVTVSDLAIVNNLVTLPITVNAIEYSSGAWSDLDGVKTVHLSITVV